MKFQQAIKKNIFPIVALLGVIGVGIYLKFPKKEPQKETPPQQQTVEYDYSDAEKTTDTLWQFGLAAQENFVVRDSAEVRRTPNVARYNTLYKLKFGTIVYTKNVDKEHKNNIEIDASLLEKESRNGFVAVYSEKPLTLSAVPVGYMAIGDIIEKSEFKNYRAQAGKAPALHIPDDIRSVIESHLNIDGVSYKLIQDPDRFNNSLSYGDYNNDGSTDFAIMLDRSDNTGSIILIYGLHPHKATYSIGYKKIHATLLKIKTIPKNTKVNVNYEVTSFPVDGLHITTMELATFFQVYDLHDKSFMVFKN